ncbi:integrase core domain containing protein, partial [Acanthamoeba castellanii str. Neff]
MCTLAPGEVIHSDLSGCFPSSAHSGAEYYITFINEATCYASMYLLSCKSEAIEAFKSYLTTSPHAACCRSLVTDQGGEYLSTRFRKLLHKHGIAHDTVAVHSPELNSIAKHFNLTIMTMVQSLLTDSCLLCSMWDEALQTTTHINNWLPTRSKSGHTLHELWMGEPPMYKHLHLFRCHAHILQPSATHSKLNDQSMPTVYLRPAHDNAQHHRLWIPNMDSIIESRDVVFSKTAKCHVTAPLALRPQTLSLTGPSATPTPPGPSMPPAAAMSSARSQTLSWMNWSVTLLMASWTGLLKTSTPTASSTNPLVMIQMSPPAALPSPTEKPKGPPAPLSPSPPPATLSPTPTTSTTMGHHILSPGFGGNGRTINLRKTTR